MSRVTTWIHCNRCFSRFANTQEFFLGKCGHILCKSCTHRGRPLCAVCKSEQKFIPLNGNLPADLVPYFQPVDLALTTAFKVAEFQSKQQHNLIEHLTSKYSHARKEYMKLLNAYKKCREDLMRMRAQVDNFNNSTMDDIDINPSNTLPSVGQFPQSRIGSDFRMPSERAPRHRSDYPARGDYASSVSSFFNQNR